MSFASHLAAQALEVEYPVGSGLQYRLKMLVGSDMLQEHVALLAAILPPSQEERLTEEAIKEATGADKIELQAQAQREAMARALDPELQGRAWQFACACVAGAVVAVKGGGDPWEAARVVVDEAKRDPDATPIRLHLSDLPDGTIAYLSSIIRTASFGGEVARERIARFRRKPGPMLDVSQSG